MSLNYDKLKQKHESEGSFWSSYADLSMVLSVLFLLLYAVANLRGSSAVLSRVMEKKVTEERVRELQKQITAFEILKEDYLRKGASEKEKEMYKEVLAQMQLLEEKAKQEKEAAKQIVSENEEKEKGLNHYQEVIKNIINANMIAQKKIKSRDDVIAKKTKNIEEMTTMMKEKEQEIAVNNAQISDIQKKLEKSIDEIKYAYRSKARSKKAAEEQIASLQKQSAEKIQVLHSQNQKASSELGQAKSQIQEASQEIAKAKGTIQTLAATAEEKTRKVATLEQEKTQVTEQLQTTKQQLTATTKELQAKQKRLLAMEDEKGRILGDLERKSAGFKRAMSDLESQHNAAMSKERGAFEAKLAQEKLGADARANAEKAYRAGVEREKGLYAAKLGELSGQLEGTKKAIAQKEGQYKSTLDGMAKQRGGLERELAALKAREMERRGLADRIRQNFQKAGVNADVNPVTGEVTIHFGAQYFDYGSSDLTGGMERVLRKAMPTYASSLFQDPKVAAKISSVEIVGFASPTYGGKYVNPKDLSPHARNAVNYNMDLSYQRAKSIFEYAFDTKRMKYAYQQELLSRTKVSGLSYLRTQDSSESPDADLSDSEYCEKYDCNKSQKVIIKFNFSER